MTTQEAQPQEFNIKVTEHRSYKSRTTGIDEPIIVINGQGIEKDQGLFSQSPQLFPIGSEMTIRAVIATKGDRVYFNNVEVVSYDKTPEQPSNQKSGSTSDDALWEGNYYWYKNNERIMYQNMFGAADRCVREFNSRMTDSAFHAKYKSPDDIMQEVARVANNGWQDHYAPLLDGASPYNPNHLIDEKQHLSDPIEERDLSDPNLPF